MTWTSHPDVKATIASTDYTEPVDVTVVLRENSLASAVITLNDYKSRLYKDLNRWDTYDVSFRDVASTGTWKPLFSGYVRDLKPILTTQGELLQVGGWGEGLPLHLMTCDSSYGIESEHPAKTRLLGITTNLIEEYVEKEFGGAATNWSLDTTHVATIHSDFQITNLQGKYLPCFDLLCRICDLVSAHAQGAHSPAQAGPHWMVNHNAELYVNTIGAHEADGSGWDTYWRGSQSASTIQVARDMIHYNFQEPDVLEYANYIIYMGPLRKPGYDYWTEDAAANTLWTSDGTITCTFSDDTTNKVVGDNSLKATESGGSTGCQFYYPSTAWNWDTGSIGSEDSVPTLNFYAMRGSDTDGSITLYLYTTRNTHDFQVLLDADMPDHSHWYHFSIPFGPFYQESSGTTTPSGNQEWRWFGQGGSQDWSDIDGIQFECQRLGGTTAELWIDDLHVYCGSYCRIAKDTSEITAHKMHQRFVRNDVALDDSMLASDTDGAIAKLAYAELLRRTAQPTVAIIQTPLALDDTQSSNPYAIPGQLLHVHAGLQSDGSTYTVDADYRITEARYLFDVQGARTLFSLTSDVYNAFALTAPSAASLLAQYVGALGHKEAKNLKGGGIDPRVPRLVDAY